MRFDRGAEGIGAGGVRRKGVTKGVTMGGFDKPIMDRMERRRALEEEGLGEFADYIAAMELVETERTQLEHRPGAQQACSPVSGEVLAAFEASFEQMMPALPPEGVEAEPAPSSAEMSARIARAFPGAAAPTERRVAAPRRAPIPAADPLGAAARALGFELGEYYDRIGLAREDAAALTRVLARESGVGAAIRSDDADLDRLEEMLAALEIDLKREQDAAAPAAPQEEAAETPARTVLREAVAVIREENALPDGALSALAEDRFVLMLDPALTRRLNARSAEAGRSLEAYVVAALEAAAPVQAEAAA